MQENITDVFIENIKDFQTDSFPERIINTAKMCMLDYFGCTLAGTRFYGNQMNHFLKGFPEKGTCSLIGGFGQRATLQTAALLNGISAHAIELDDGHRIGMLHLAAPIISALLAVAEKERIHTNDFLRGIVVGYEVAIRLACCVQPDCKLKGYHATGTCGTLGAAMGIATALHFDKEQMKSSLSAAITSAAGVLEMIEGDTELKPYNAGRAAMDGVTAAYIGKARFKAPEDALGGKRGFLKVMANEPKLRYLTDFDDDKLMIETIYMKPYAACRHCHPSIEAALNIRKMKGFQLEEVEDIHVDTYKLAVAGHDHVNIAGVNSAKMSIPYSLAVSLYTGKGGLDEFTETYIGNPEVQAITNKVTVSDKDELTALCPQKRIAEVTVKTTQGIFKKRVDYPKGEPENPLFQQELEDKFCGLAMYGGLTSDECDKVISEINKSDFDLIKILKIVCK